MPADPKLRTTAGEQAYGHPEAFVRRPHLAWQDGDYDRIGWRSWVDPKDVHSFAFVGIHLGPETIHDDVPDLYFFVQTKKGSDAQKTLEARNDDVRVALDVLAEDPTIRVRHGRGGWEVYAIRRSLVEVARADDPTDATFAFFRECVSSESGKTLLSIYLAALTSETRM